MERSKKRLKLQDNHLKLGMPFRLNVLI